VLANGGKRHPPSRPGGGAKKEGRTSLKTVQCQKGSQRHGERMLEGGRPQKRLEEGSSKKRKKAKPAGCHKQTGFLKPRGLDEKPKKSESSNKGNRGDPKSPLGGGGLGEWRPSPIKGKKRKQILKKLLLNGNEF